MSHNHYKVSILLCILYLEINSHARVLYTEPYSSAKRTKQSWPAVHHDPHWSAWKCKQGTLVEVHGLMIEPQQLINLSITEETNYGTHKTL